MYSGHNGGATSTANNTIKSRKPRGQNAITDIVDPTTGKNISHEIYKDNETIQSGESSNRETPQLQVSWNINFLTIDYESFTFELVLNTKSVRHNYYILARFLNTLKQKSK